jgi:hypothetical protein
VTPNDYGYILLSVSALITAIGGLAVFKARSEPTPRKPDDTLHRIEGNQQRMESKLDIILDRTHR